MVWSHSPMVFCFNGSTNILLCDSYLLGCAPSFKQTVDIEEVILVKIPTQLGK